MIVKQLVWRASSLVTGAALPAFAALLTLAFVLACAIAIRNYRAARLDFLPWPGSPSLRDPGRTGVAGLREVTFEAPEGVRLSGWQVPSKNRAAVIITHGTNADRTSMLSEVKLLAGAGFGVLAFDWPGDGASGGAIHWGSTERHALTAAVAWLAAQPDVDPGRIGGLGFSMGGYVMTQVAATDRRLKAVVIEAAPPDFREYLRHMHRHWGYLSRWPAYWAMRESGMAPGEMRPVAVIGGIAPRPVLIIGGAADPVIPPDMTREMYAAAGVPKSLWIVPQAAHGGYAGAAPAEYERRLLGFFGDGLLR